MTKKIIGISIDIKVLQNIDDKRGMIPRSRFIEKILEKTTMNHND